MHTDFALENYYFSDPQMCFLLQNFIRDPYATTMGSFSKVTHFLRDVLLQSDNPMTRPQEEVAELLQDDLPGMEVNQQDEPGYEMVTKVWKKKGQIVKMFVLLKQNSGRNIISEVPLEFIILKSCTYSSSCFCKPYLLSI